MNMTQTLEQLTGSPLAACSDRQIYLALLELVRRKAGERREPVRGRKLYYISAEFLIGKLLSNNLINLGLYDQVRTALADAGKNLADIEEVEPEPSLGNGGLGRLAACFLDSLATLDLPGDGIGLRYHCGLFRQDLQGGFQAEKPDPWLSEHSWAERTEITYPVSLAGKTYQARLYRLAVTGYGGRTNTLNLFDLDTVDESIIREGIAFDKTDIAKNLTLFLYPDDSDEAGRRLRIYQQYLMVSAGAQLLLDECVARGSDLHDLADCWGSGASNLRKPAASSPMSAPTPTTPSWPKRWKSGPAPTWTMWCPSSCRSSKSWMKPPAPAPTTRRWPSWTGTRWSTWPTWTSTSATRSTAWPRCTPGSLNRPSSTISTNSTPKSSTTRPTASPSAAGCWNATPP